MVVLVFVLLLLLVVVLVVLLLTGVCNSCCNCCFDATDAAAFPCCSSAVPSARRTSFLVEFAVCGRDGHHRLRLEPITPTLKRGKMLATEWRPTSSPVESVSKKLLLLDQWAMARHFGCPCLGWNDIRTRAALPRRADFREAAICRHHAHELIERHPAAVL